MKRLVDQPYYNQRHRNENLCLSPFSEQGLIFTATEDMGK